MSSSANKGQFAPGKSGNPSRQFKPGQSGNPRGKPARKGVRDLVGEKALGEIVEAIAKAAKDGNALAAKLLIPPMKPELARVAVPELESAATPTDKAQAILLAAARGQVSPDAAVALSTVLANALKVTEVDELARRIEALEKRQ